MAATSSTHHPPAGRRGGIEVPLFGPLLAAEELAEAGEALLARNLKFLGEEMKRTTQPPPHPATHNVIRLDLRTMRLRDYGGPTGVPTLVDAPFAGHSAMIADYHKGQSLIETLLAARIGPVFLTDWKSASLDMKDLEIDQYLAELHVAVEEAGGRVNLVGLCQGGWMAAIYAARFPHRVASLVLAGAPIDTAAGDGRIKRMVHLCPASFYQELVDLGGGLMRGAFVLGGWKNMHPAQHYVQEHIDLYEHIDDPAYLRKQDVFERWYENPIDLPGRWYMQAITQIFQENRLARGRFVALGRRISLRAIACPTYLLAGESDDITTAEQVFNARQLIGTRPEAIVQKLVPGGHIGLFMGARTLAETWPAIARWIAGQG